MGSPESLEGGAYRRGKGGGCYITFMMGVLLVLCGVCIAVAVGLIVHFVHPDRDKSCTEVIPEDIMNGNCPPPDVGEVPEQEVWDACVNISIANDECIPSPACEPERWTESPPLWELPPVCEDDSGEGEDEEVDYRLPPNFTPVSYRISFFPDIYAVDGDDVVDPELFTFQGTVVMTLACDVASDRIHFHTRDMTLIESTLSIEDISETPAVPYAHISVEKHPVTEIVEIWLTEQIPAGAQIQLTIEYRGPITGDMSGMYYSYYEQEGTTEMQYMLATQFQATDARAAFPCLDEPHFRPTYNISIRRREDFLSLSNMPIFISTPDPDDDTYFIDEYEESIAMPTYLVAWAVSRFSFTENVAGGDLADGDLGNITVKEMRYYARPDQVDIGATDWAGAICPPMFDYLEWYFGVPYSLPKLDQIAIPQFSAGAMENWGLATYREIRMLVDRTIAKLYDQQRASGTLGHELLHKWIGNLLTCEWWDDLWLNEGFARYFQHRALQYGTRNIYDDTADIYPSPAWDVEQAFISQVVQAVLDIDDTGSSTPIINNASSPASIDQMFSSYTYDKGGSLLRMFDNSMGEDVFMEAQRQYVQNNQDSSVTTDDFLLELDNAIDPVHVRPDGNYGNAFRTWLYQMGFPVVTVSRAGRDLTFVQEVFLLDPVKPIREKYPSIYNYTWTVPVTYLSGSATPDYDVYDLVWLYDKTDVHVDNALVADTEWYIVNIRQTGYYRVNYDLDNWNNIITLLNNSNNYTAIHPINRAALIDDSYHLARAGHIDHVLALQLTEYLVHDEDWLPFDSFNYNIAYLKGLYALSPDHPHFQAYVRSRVEPNYNRIGWNVTTDTFDTSNLLDVYLMEQILKLSCEYGLQACIDEAVRRYETWRDAPTDLTPEDIKPDVRDVVYCYGFHYYDDGSGSSDADFQMILMLYGEQEEERESDRLRDTLACASEPYLLQTLYDLAQSGDPRIKPSDRTTVMVNVADIPEMQGYVWTQLNENWDQDIPGQTSVLTTITNRFSSQDELNMFEEFVSTHPARTESMYLTYSDIRYSIQANMRWMERNGAAVAAYLQQYV